MEPLRVRRADAAPRVGIEELWGRLGASAITDRDLSDEAKVLLAAIYLSMAQDRNPVACLATNHELAGLIGKHPRNVQRRLAELVARGHVTVDRVRSVEGSPRAIRPAAKLKGGRQVSDTAAAPCQDGSGAVGGRQRRRGGGGSGAPPNKVETKGERSEQQDGGCAPVVAPSSPTGEADPCPPGRGDFLARLAGDLAGVLAVEDEKPRTRTRGAKRSPGGNLARTPGAGARTTVLDAKDCTTPPSQKSRGEIPIET